MVFVVEGQNALDDHRKRDRDDYAVWRKKRDQMRTRNILQFYQHYPECVPNDQIDPNSYDGMYWWDSHKMRSKFESFIREKDQDISKKAKLTKREKRREKRAKAEKMYRSDPKFRRLYDRVADYFADGLKEERRAMDNGEESISGLFAKWAPSPRMSHDRITNIAEGIIQRLYPDTYIYRDLDLRIKYAKEYLSEIRRAAQIPETFTGSGEWNLVNYKLMPSRCRFMFGEMYRRHDEERYDAFIEKAKEQAESGERITMVSAGALLPHDIINRITRTDTRLNDELGIQWMRMIQDVKDSGNLPNALAICGVSASMEGRPMDVSVALSMLVSDVTTGPCSNKVITFSRDPELVRIPLATVDTIASRVAFMKQMNWGGNTNFQSVFELILGDAQRQNISADQMPSVLFCFSDMEFDQAHAGNWKTDLELIRAKYTKAGYSVPTIVFWNLRDSGSKPASYNETGVVMLSGFGAGMLKSFLNFRLDDIRAPTPLEHLIASLVHYDDLVLANEDM